MTAGSELCASLPWGGVGESAFGESGRTLAGADGASAMALQPPPHLLTTLPAPAGGGRCVRPCRSERAEVVRGEHPWALRRRLEPWLPGRRLQEVLPGLPRRRAEPGRGTDGPGARGLPADSPAPRFARQATSSVGSGVRSEREKEWP